MLILLAALLLAEPAAPPAPEPAPKPAADAPPHTALTPEQAVDPNGVPAWAKRKRLAPVQNCSSRPNISVDSWRAERDPKSRVGATRNVPIKTTCK